MNDRFLYRAKRTDNGEWITGYLLVDKKDFYICAKPYECMDEYSSLNGQSYGFGGFKFVDQSTICQRVPCGGCSLDEKPIWENDIVTDGYYVGVVQFGVYESKFFGFFIEWKNGYEGLREDFLYWLPKIKSIGNIFDNPELLEVGE